MGLNYFEKINLKNFRNYVYNFSNTKAINAINNFIKPIITIIMVAKINIANIMPNIMIAKKTNIEPKIVITIIATILVIASQSLVNSRANSIPAIAPKKAMIVVRFILTSLLNLNI